MKLTNSTFMLYAAKHYDNPICIDATEFYEDLNHIRSIYRLFNKYDKNGTLKDKLILNHLRILYNVFDHIAMTKMLCFKLNLQMHMLKPFLILLNYWPRTNMLHIENYDAIMDMHIVSALRKI